MSKGHDRANMVLGPFAPQQRSRPSGRDTQLDLVFLNETQKSPKQIKKFLLYLYIFSSQNFYLTLEPYIAYSILTPL